MISSVSNFKHVRRLAFLSLYCRDVEAAAGWRVKFHFVNLCRLEMASGVCFVGVTGDSNSRLCRLEIGETWRAASSERCNKPAFFN